MTKTAFSSCFTGWIPRTENTEVMNVKDDAFAEILDLNWKITEHGLLYTRAAAQS